MVRALTALMAVVTLLVACTSDTNTPEESDESTAPANDCDAELARAFDAWGEAGFSGSVAIATGGKFDCQAGYGLANQAKRTPNTAHTVFSIGSVSKAFTAAAVLDLVDGGDLALTDRAGDLVPGLSGPVADATVEQLLLHTSGLTGSHGQDHTPLDKDAAVAAISALGQAFPPGSDFLYSNAGYSLLAVIVEEVSGTPFRDYMADEILTGGGFWDGEPAAPGPRAVGYLDDGPTAEMGDFAGPPWALAGNGDLAMTAPQLAAWATGLFSGDVVSPDAVETLTSLGFPQADGVSEVPGWVAYDESLIGQPFLTTAGGGGDIGHNAVVAWLPESEQAIVIMSNTVDVSAEDLLDEIGPALAAGDPLPVPDTPGGEVDPESLAAAEGTYEMDGGGSFTVTADDDGLAVEATGADAVAALFPLPDGVTADDVAGHETRVRELLTGATAVGREELAAIEDDLGALGDITLAGTIVTDGELRTYVNTTLGGEPSLLWYALDDEGGISAAEVDTEPPTLPLAPGGDGRFRPADPTSHRADLTVTIADGVLTIAGPAGDVQARSAG